MRTQPSGVSPPVSAFPRLSKSKFLSGQQCHKRLYLEIHSPKFATPPDEHTQAILDQGTQMGELARKRYPGGVLVEADYRHVPEALRRTAELVADPSVHAIFEGAFQYERVLIRVDILERMMIPDSGATWWRLIEVKSSTKVKGPHCDDLALQTYVLGGAGLLLAGSCLMHVNNQYVYLGGEIAINDLFVVRDVTQEVSRRLGDVPARLAEMKSMLLLPLAPAIEPSGHCHVPYECSFWEHCTEHKSDRWIGYLPGDQKTISVLVRTGVDTIDEIPRGFPLTAVQQRMKDNREWISPALKKVVDTLRYPIHHVDFETFMPGIPRFPLTRPYQTIPTQWSNHILAEDGTLRHEEYLCMEAQDPREELVAALIDSVGTEGHICVYSGYERAILEKLAQVLPAFRQELQDMITRLWDLFPVVRDYYYHPEFHGSFSIKSVAPALAPELTYHDLEIQAGGVAAIQYDRMVFRETDWVEKVRIREALLKYCERDTLAMVELRRVLEQKALYGLGASPPATP